MNDRLDYVSVETQKDAEELVKKLVTKIQLIYDENDNLNKNLVYWHPDLIQPRNKVTYDGKFYVREYWGDKNNVSFALSEADVFVTYTNYETQPNIRKLKIDNFYIYFYEN